MKLRWKNKHDRVWFAYDEAGDIGFVFGAPAPIKAAKLWVLDEYLAHK